MTVANEHVPPDLLAGHEASDHHRDVIEVVDVVTCFYCGHIGHPQDITEWVDGGQTALCPKCGIDSVLPGTYPSEFIVRMTAYWFGRRG
jgi:hypothetical protein